MRIIFIAFFILFAVSLKAQFRKATLQASGLTCAMCSNAINKALSKISFVEKVESDISKSAFNIYFKENAAVDFDLLRKKVEEAGFSVSLLQVVAKVSGLSVKEKEVFTIAGTTLLFMNVNNQLLNGEVVITILDKNFIPIKEFKKNSASAVESYKTGVQNGKRIYHVTI